jgi:cytoskeletal protein CcmA (bactofilin family)
VTSRHLAATYFHHARVIERGSGVFSDLTGVFMFTRNSSAELKTPAPPTTNSHRGNGVQQQHRTGPSASGDKSVIGNDLKIIGQGLKIIGQGILQVDGEIEGDVQAAEVIVGEQGSVTGMVAGEQVVVRGRVSGALCGKSIVLQSSCNVEGDIHHMSLAIEQGAMFDGRSRRLADQSQLEAVINAKAGGHS